MKLEAQSAACGEGWWSKEAVCLQGFRDVDCIDGNCGRVFESFGGTAGGGCLEDRFEL